MNHKVGDVILVLRRASNITQEDLAQRLGITQAALSRYENDLREPDEEMLHKIGDVFGVTVEFLRHEYRMRGGIAADAHMRRQRTAKPSDWKRVEARLNVLRMHSMYLLERFPLHPQNQVIQLDPEMQSPSQAATMLRAAWKMPIGPVRNMTRWVESAGVIVVEEDFGTHRIDGMSQWAGEYAVIIINNALSTDRKRLTVAHELGHLVLHSQYLDAGAEDEANDFAAELLMPEHVIASQLQRLTLGKSYDLKLEWGVSMQALYERAYRMGKVTGAERQQFYRQLTRRGWKIREPGSDDLLPEKPELAEFVGRQLDQSGLTQTEILRLVGARRAESTPFGIPKRRLRAV